MIPERLHVIPEFRYRKIIFNLVPSQKRMVAEYMHVSREITGHELDGAKEDKGIKNKLFHWMSPCLYEYLIHRLKERIAT
jgi:hypothetical protein